MQILHFDWLRYEGFNINSHRVAKFAGFSLFFFPYFPFSIFFPYFPFFFPFSSFIIAFSVQLVG